MTEDLLSRTAVDRNLERLTRLRMKGRKLVGVQFDPVSKTWFAFLGNTLVPIRRRAASTPSGVASIALTAPRKGPGKNPSRKK
jgi:hypothetical protein